MMLSYHLTVVKDASEKKLKVGGKRRRRSSNIIVKADSRSAATCRINIPEEILIEILVRLPADSLMRFKCVSRHWSSLISSRYFTNLFFKFSSSTTRERRMFMTVVDNCHPITVRLLSASLRHNIFFPSLTFLPHRQLNHDYMHFVQAFRGLMCLRVNRVIRIINVTTKQVLILPEVKDNMLKRYMWNYFGYDPVNDEYKVLNTVSSLKYSKEGRRVRSETRILVLGAGVSWRNTKSCTSPPPPHHPTSQGISINGVLYYGACCPEIEHVLMSFDLNSEEFNLIDLPIKAGIIWYSGFIDNLMNYQGKVAVFLCSRGTTECKLDLWVVEDAAKSIWSHKIFVLPYHQLRDSFDVNSFSIKGSSCSGEIRLFGRRNMNRNDGKATYAIYDMEKNCITREVFVEPLCSNFSRPTNLWDDVENIMYLKV